VPLIVPGFVQRQLATITNENLLINTLALQEARESSAFALMEGVKKYAGV